jgi:cytoskeletal protein RodZ
MKVALGTALLVLLAGTTMYAQDQDKEKEKPAQQEEKKQEPAAKEHEQPKAQEQQKDQAKQTEKEKSDAAKQQQQAAHQQQQQAAKQQQQQAAKQQQVDKQQQVARQDHAQDQQAQRDGGNRNSRRISEQDFHAHFGREHTFRVTRSNDHRFNYGGYYWVYNDPWPSDWAYTDAVYVDEIDGEYYLIDPVHPGLRLLIVIAD